MAAGADMAAVSMHKSGGSLTPILAVAHRFCNAGGTCAADYQFDTDYQWFLLLLSSLDISRRNLALRGKEAFAKVVSMAEYAREEINAIDGYYAYSRELVNGDSIFDFDVTKLSVNTLNVGLCRH